MNNITMPTLLLNKNISIKNISKIKDKADSNNLILRPHFKTHQSLEIGKWFKNLGIDRITVSSISMAKYFSKDWDDILIAFPINILEIQTLNNISEKCNLSILVDNYNVLEHLTDKLTKNVNVYIKIDVGYRRAGIMYKNLKEIDKIINYCYHYDKLNFKGFVSHFGDTYNSNSMSDIIDTYEKSIIKLSKIRESHENYEYSVGDTPSCSLVNDYPSYITEIRPGNFVFYDLFQHLIGSCQIEDIALRMVCPIVSVYKERNEILIYGGSVHFSKDYIQESDNKHFGYVYNYKNLWNEKNRVGIVKSLSQEHGVVQVDNTKNFKIGDLVSIIPVHSCLTVDKMQHFLINEDKYSIKGQSSP